MSDQPGAPTTVSSPSPLTLFAGLALVAALFFPRFLVGLPIFGCLGLCLAAFLRKERWRPLAVLVGVLAVGLLAVSEAPAGSFASPAQVTYSVTGSARTVSLTLTNAEGGTEQLTASPPWTNSFASHSGAFVYVAAQNQENYGDVTCTISINGTEFKTSTSSGEYGIADCSGSVP